MIQAIHGSIQGRARYKVKELYRSESLQMFLEEQLSRLSDVKRARASSVTGNVLVHYNSGNTVQTIAALLEEIVSDYRTKRSCRESENSRPELSPGAPPSPVGGPFSEGFQGSSIHKGIKGLLPSPWGTEAPCPKPWHAMDCESILQEWGTSIFSGLPRESAAENLQKYGLNTLPESEGRSRWSIFIDQFKSIPVALLGVSAGISVATGGVVDALVIMGVVVINAAIGFVTEDNAERTIESLKTLVRPSAQVVRDGIVTEVGMEEVALGDLLELKPGVYIAADSRLIESSNLTVDESSLTGESLPVAKTHQRVLAQSTPLADRLNMLYMGTLVTGGQGLAVVVATGRGTELGQLRLLVEDAGAPETPLEKQLARIGNQLVAISGAICGAVFLMGIARGSGLLYMLNASIALAVAAVPEGLTAVATTTLAIGINKMKNQKVLIRHLSAVETLGAIQTICFDKTGTVTQNRMTAQRVYAGDKRIEVSDTLFNWENGCLDVPSCRELMDLLHVAILCSESNIAKRGNEYILQGSSTENALLNMALKAGFDLCRVRESYPILKTNHRAEDRHFMGTLHGCQDGRKLVAVKGSPLEVLAMCDWRMCDGEKIALTDEDRRSIDIENERMAGDALRVLGFASLVADDEKAFDSSRGLVWLGLVGMADPVREGVKDLIARFHEAKIETIMITGDQSPTAYAIGRDLKLSREAPLEIMDSTHLADVDADALRSLSRRIHVFARVSPAHKLQIVQALQRAGHVVAMTGDGINDGPALKAADVGVALGKSGTDIAREVADVVLENDDLETMIVAVSHGRTIYSNIRKALHFLLSTNFSEIMVMFAAGAVGLGHPLTAMQLLWINLLSDIFPGLALALEPPEPDVMKRPPRNPEEPIVTGSDFKRLTVESAVMSAGALATYGYGITKYGMGANAGTLAFHSLTLAQLLHAFSCRSEHHSIFSKERMPANPYLNVALSASLGLQVLTMVVPGLRGLLGLTPITLVDAVWIGSSAALPLLVNEATKAPSQEGLS
ncbi:calcium-translocating P-type ATPase, SERCA-type [Desulforhabdus sp. TSK]|nr:HAD-IC family P-type ATPase [Desulforhabdus sp. TSK]GKT10157.1 calcium-translocating P-type ATPase, SERCA-type [Desulforhabdus sp. TSK]